MNKSAFSAADAIMLSIPLVLCGLIMLLVKLLTVRYKRIIKEERRAAVGQPEGVKTSIRS